MDYCLRLDNVPRKGNTHWTLITLALRPTSRVQKTSFLSLPVFHRNKNPISPAWKSVTNLRNLLSFESPEIPQLHSTDVKIMQKIHRDIQKISNGKIATGRRCDNMTKHVSRFTPSHSLFGPECWNSSSKFYFKPHAICRRTEEKSSSFAYIHSPYGIHKKHHS